MSVPATACSTSVVHPRQRRWAIERHHRNAPGQKGTHCRWRQGRRGDQAFQRIAQRCLCGGLCAGFSFHWHQQQLLAVRRQRPSDAADHGRVGLQCELGDDHADHVGAPGDQRARERVGRVSQLRRHRENPRPRRRRDLGPVLEAARHRGLRHVGRRRDVVRRDPPGVVFLPPQQTQDWSLAALRTKTECHTEGLPVFERQRIGRNCTTGSSLALDGVAERRRETGKAEAA